MQGATGRKAACVVVTQDLPEEVPQSVVGERTGLFKVGCELRVGNVQQDDPHAAIDLLVLDKARRIVLYVLPRAGVVVPPRQLLRVPRLLEQIDTPPAFPSHRLRDEYVRTTFERGRDCLLYEGKRESLREVVNPRLTIRTRDCALLHAFLCGHNNTPISTDPRTGSTKICCTFEYPPHGVVNKASKGS
jgi:hypothetical protein